MSVNLSRFSFAATSWSPFGRMKKRSEFFCNGEANLIKYFFQINFYQTPL